MRLSLIIAAHNKGDALWRTVESCVETCAGLDYEIVVAVPEDEVRASTVSPAARGEQAGLEASHADEAKAASGGASSDQAAVTPVVDTAAEGDAGAPLAGLTGRQRKRRLKGRRLTKPAEVAPGEGGKQASLTPEQRLLLLDTWQRSGLPAKDFAALVGVSKHTLYKRKQRFDQQGPAGLMDQPRGARCGSRLPGVDQTHHLNDQAAAPQLGLPADQ